MRKLAVLAGLMMSLLAGPTFADPVKLKFAFFGSDQQTTYVTGLKPFIDAVNAEGKGLVEIDPYASGALGRDPTQQVRMVDDGTADIAFAVLGYTPERFPDNSLLELPGLFQDARQATLVFTRLVAADKLAGYSDFFVVGALGPNPATMHMRTPVASLDDLKGKGVNANGPIQTTALKSLGMNPIFLPLAAVADAIGTGKIDGASAPPDALVDFGVARVVTYHYLLPVSMAPLAVLMNRKKFDSLPAEAQAVIRKYSGEWIAMRFIEGVEARDSQIIDQWKSNPQRKVIVPSAGDIAKVGVVFQAISDEWQKGDRRKQELLKLAQAEIVKLRAPQ